MTNQKELIHNSNWDILVVIDACRYDYFARYYKEVFSNGKLKKVITPSVWTFGWIVETFGNKYWNDIVFLKNWVSGYILSEEEKKNGTKKWIITDIIKRLKYQRYAKSDLFNVVIKMQEGVEYSTLHPKVTYDYACDAIKDYPNKRIIVSFRQVHEPYIGWLEKGMVKDEQQTWRRGNSIFKKFKRLVYINVLQKILTSEQIWTIIDKFGLPSNGSVGKVWVKKGWDEVRKGYIDDLILVLEYIKKIANKYPNKKIAVTSDHGELLGEYGRFGHSTNRRYKEIIEVPWFVINDKN